MNVRGFSLSFSPLDSTRRMRRRLSIVSFGGSRDLRDLVGLGGSARYQYVLLFLSTTGWRYVLNHFTALLVSGNNISFNGNRFAWNGNGAYW